MLGIKPWSGDDDYECWSTLITLVIRVAYVSIKNSIIKPIYRPRKKEFGTQHDKFYQQKNVPIFGPNKPFCQRNPTFNFSLSQCKLGFYYSNAFITPTTYKYAHINVKTKKWMYLPFVIKNSVRSFKCKLLYYNEFDI